VRWLVVGLVAAACSDCIRVGQRVLADKPDDPRGPYRSLRELKVVPGSLSTEPPFMVELDPDVASVFSDSATVNCVLRPLASMIHAEAALLSQKAVDEPVAGSDSDR